MDKEEFKLVVGALIAIGIILLALWIFTMFYSTVNEAVGPPWFKTLIT